MVSIQIDRQVVNYWKGYQEMIARRIAYIVVGRLELEAGTDKLQVPFLKENGTWVLDSGNDWFLRFLDDGGMELAYRYSTPAMEATLPALKVVIENLVGRIDRN